MPLFSLHCLDKADATALRERWRDDHVAHVRTSGMTRFAGALLSETGEVIGSMSVIESSDLAAAQSFVASDPFAREGVYRSAELHPFRLAVLDLSAGPT